MPRERRTPRRHTVHTHDPRYNVSQYGRGHGVVSISREDQRGRPESKMIRGQEVFPLQPFAKGEDWVDCYRSDRMELRYWDFDENYPFLKKAPFGYWYWIPKKEQTRYFFHKKNAPPTSTFHIDAISRKDAIAQMKDLMDRDNSSGFYPGETHSVDDWEIIGSEKWKNGKLAHHR